MVICFRPRKLVTKPNALTRHWDVYPKEGSSNYASINPQNLRPIFTDKQLASSLRTTTFWLPALRGSLIMDTEWLQADIVSSLQSDPMALEHLSDEAESRWTTSPDRPLQLDDCIYVPDSGMLRLHVLQYAHDHPLLGHFSQSKTLDQVRRHYTWPGLKEFVQHYCKSCTTCSQAKPRQHKHYGLLKQLLVPKRPWNSISIDFIEQLPLSLGYTFILIVVDHLSKQGIFIATHDTITSSDLTWLFVIHIFSKHGVPAHVTCDRGSERRVHLMLLSVPWHGPRHEVTLHLGLPSGR